MIGVPCIYEHDPSSSELVQHSNPRRLLRRSTVRGRHRKGKWHSEIRASVGTLLRRVRNARPDIPLMMLRIGLQFTLRSEEHTSELQSLMRISYASFC